MIKKPVSMSTWIIGLISPETTGADGLMLLLSQRLLVRQTILYVSVDVRTIFQSLSLRTTGLWNTLVFYSAFQHDSL